MSEFKGTGVPWCLEDRRDLSPDEYSDPGICIGAILPDVGFVSVAFVAYGCSEAKAIGEQMEIADRIVRAVNSHDDLLAALQAYVNGDPTQHKCAPGTSHAASHLARLEAAQSALAKATKS